MFRNISFIGQETLARHYKRAYLGGRPVALELDDALSLDHLRAQAAAAGVSVQQADDVHE